MAGKWGELKTECSQHLTAIYSQLNRIKQPIKYY